MNADLLNLEFIKLNLPPEYHESLAKAKKALIHTIAELPIEEIRQGKKAYFCPECGGNISKVDSPHVCVHCGKNLIR